MTNIAFSLTAPLPCCMPGDELGQHATMADLGTQWTQLQGVLCTVQMSWRVEWAAQPFLGPQQQDSQSWLPCAVQGSRICHQGCQEGLGLGQPGRRQDDACETWLEDAFKSSVGCCLVGQPTATCKPAEGRAASHRAIPSASLL